MNEVIDQLRSSLGDRFAVEGEVGRGGMGLVFRARDLEHDRDVAIKVLRPEFRVSVASARWVREIEIVHQLDHPNILSMYDSGEAGGLLYSVMPFVDGESLRQRLRREDQLPLDDALRIAYQIADAMAYAHERGIVHRDIKPANVLLADGRALVSDFGIARAITVAGGDEVTESGVAVGTPSYMSPEQAAGGSKVDGRSDVYSLGCVLYEMLVGEPPFTGHSAQVIIARQIQERHPAVRVPRPSVPKAVEYAVDRALEKTPADRFSTSGEFRDALDGFVTGDFTADVRIRRRKPRRRWSVPTAAALVVVAMAGWLLWPRNPPVLNGSQVVVFPPVVSAESGDITWIAEGLPIIVSSALEGARLRGLLGRKWLNARQRENPATLSRRAQRALARELGARFFISGDAVAVGETIQLRLDLIDSEGDTLIHEVREIGDRAELASLGFRAASRLVSKIRPGDGLFAPSPIEGHEPEAIDEFFRGEIAYHRGQFVQAVDHYERALAADSRLWMAALRASHAAFWSREDWNRSSELLALALPDTGQMNNAQLFLARGMDAAFRGHADAALDNLDRALQADPSLPEVWMARGEVLQWLLPDVSRRDSLALEAFRRVVELDPEFVPALYHLQQLTLRSGDVQGGQRLYRKYTQALPDSRVFRPIQLMVQCLVEGPESIDWRKEVSTGPVDVLQAARSLSVGGANLECAERGLEGLVAHDSSEFRNSAKSAAFELQTLYVARRSLGRAKALSDSLTVSYNPIWAMFSVVYAAAAGVLYDDAVRFVDSLGTDYSAIDFQELWAIALWESHNGRADALEAILRALVHRRTAGLNPDHAVASLLKLEAVVQARLLLARGDSTAAISALRALRPEAPAWSIRQNAWDPLAAEQMLLARLLMARAHGASSDDEAIRDYRDALNIALNIANGEPVIFLAYLRPSLEIVHAAATEIGDARLMSQASARLASLDDHPDSQ